MKIRYKKTFLIYICALVIGVLSLFNSALNSAPKTSAEMPFYNLKPQFLTVRAEFYTSYPSSSEERKSNIILATKSLNNTFVDVGAEFSFNYTVGPRTEKRGYKVSKIIFNGAFVDGVGGGVCQVSTTLYNAILLAGLKVTEYHPHSLPVGYVAPSFDAMVNSGSADLRFINNTHNPIILKTFADENKVTIEVWGEPMQERYLRQSQITEYIPAPVEEIVLDEKGEYPHLYEGERMTIQYSKKGYRSQATLVKMLNGKVVDKSIIRKDKYNAIKGVVIEGKAQRPQINMDEQKNLYFEPIN